MARTRNVNYTRLPVNELGRKALRREGSSRRLYGVFIGEAVASNPTDPFFAVVQVSRLYRRMVVSQSRVVEGGRS